LLYYFGVHLFSTPTENTIYIVIVRSRKKKQTPPKLVSDGYFSRQSENLSLNV